MIITLYTSEILNHLRTISHDEAANIAEPDMRYRIEAGSDKMAELYRCIRSAASKLAGRCSRWLNDMYESDKNNELPTPFPSEYSFEFALNERRAINTAEPLMEAMHSFMVEYALTKFYSIVNQGELSNKHSLLALEAGNQIDSLLYTKQPPIV